MPRSQPLLAQRVPRESGAASPRYGGGTLPQGGARLASQAQQQTGARACDLDEPQTTKSPAKHNMSLSVLLLLLPSLCSALVVSPLAASTQPRLPAISMQLSTEERIETMISDNKCVFIRLLLLLHPLHCPAMWTAVGRISVASLAVAHSS